MIKCGWASQDERGRASGGKAGDQTGREVKVGNWYNFGQNCVIRFKNADEGRKFARVIKSLCNNDCVGYDQSQRTTLYEELKKQAFDYTKLKTKCETDCSAMIAAALACIGVKISKNAWTGNLVPMCRATGKFTFHTDAKYLTSDKYLKTGDIILNTAAHVITALEDGEAAKKKTVKKPKGKYAGKLPKFPPKGYIQKGDTGSNVKLLQSFLKWYGTYTGSIDGSAGPKTDTAIRDFQRAEKITADGSFGKKSLAKAKKYKESK